MRHLTSVPRVATVDQVTADAESLVQRGRHAAAERHLREQAARHARRGRFAEALELLIALGRLLAERGRALDAIRAFQAATLPPSSEPSGPSVALRIWLASTLTDAGELAAAEQRAREVRRELREDDDDFAWATAVLARTCLWQGRLDEARTLVDACPVTAASEPRDAFVQSTVARVLVASGELFAAGQRVDALVRAGTPPGSLTTLIVLGAQLRLACAAGQLDRAELLMREGQGLCRQLRLPVRRARLIAIWAQGLRAAGRVVEAARALRHLEHRPSPGLPDKVAGPWRSSTSPSAPLAQLCEPAARDSGEPRFTASLIERLSAVDGRSVVPALDIIREALGAVRVEAAFLADAASGLALDAPAQVLAASGHSTPTLVAGEVLRRSVASSRVTSAWEEHAVPVRGDGMSTAVLAARWDGRAPAGVVSSLPWIAALIAPLVATDVGERERATAADERVAGLLGTSAAMSAVRLAALRAARSPFAVLVVGESGVGKELVARAIHHVGPRSGRPFADVNCAALPDDLLEAELFGHARGAYTGATVDRPGLFEEAHGGTLFLDEIVELSPRAQAKLLRTLQQREVRRLGESRTRAIDVRLVSAANRDPRTEATRGAFRADLLYRVDVIRIEIPPLRDRREDIPLLATRLWPELAASVGSQATLGRGLVARLTDYDWPGNVRELQNVLAGLAVAAPRHGRVDRDDLPRHIKGVAASNNVPLEAARLTCDRAAVSAALARAGGQRSRAAQDLGVSRQGLAKLMARVGLR